MKMACVHSSFSSPRIGVVGIGSSSCSTNRPGLVELSFRRRLCVAPCHKMFVPGFGEKSPEAKAAASLHNFFTFVALKIVLAQLQDYNKEEYAELMSFSDRVPLKDGDHFCAALMRESPRLALRIMEVRSAYAQKDFEWDRLQSLSSKQMDKSNTNLMREFVVETTTFQTGE